MSLKILYLGENWYGSCARACCYALRRQGCDVVDIDIQTMIPQLRNKIGRAMVRLIWPIIVEDYNKRILQMAREFKPDILLAFKGSMVEAATLREVRSNGVVLYNYFPDTRPAEHGKQLAESIDLYDCVFYTKRFWMSHRPAEIVHPELRFVNHGYDSEVHRRWQLEEKDLRTYQHDVLVIGSHTPYKEQVLSELVAKMSSLDLFIYGERWGERCANPELRKRIAGIGVFGSGYAKAIQAARINLAVLAWDITRIDKDETTTRTFEIPACGGFMLHQRTDELLELYKDGEEVVSYGDVDELREKIPYYLAHPEERAAIAQRGQARCVPAYSYDTRMAEILAYHDERLEKLKLANRGT